MHFGCRGNAKEIMRLEFMVDVLGGISNALSYFEISSNF